MKNTKFITTLLLLASGFYCHAQYGKDLQPGVNRHINVNTWNPTQETLYTVDSNEVNEIDFGKKENKGAFKVVFPFRGINTDSESIFSFKKSQITGTHITKKSGITNIELTPEGFEVTYKIKKKAGPVDDYVAINTYNGRFLLRLTGEIIEAPKRD